MEQGNLSINSENIFPIIKKWLYSDHDIFVRELVSNGCDAVTKLKKLEMIGEANIPDNNVYQIKVIVNPTEKSIKFIDNGIGMTSDEVKEYINQIAFSGAEDFLKKYKDKASDDQIIGHFGLGFYSAFMVADKVTIDTLSYKDGAKAVLWESEGGTTFEMTDSGRTERGTEITLYLNDESYEFSNEYRMKEVLDKYCSFMPIPIFFENTDAPKETEDEKAKKKEEKEKKKAEKAKKKMEKAAKKAADEAFGEETEDIPEEEDEEEPEEDDSPKPINNTTPLWAKHPNECKEEEYKEFYRNVFHDYKEPLFWIHLNMDYPFNLKGILYFPKLNLEYDKLEGVIKLYSNQVFIADNIKEVIPEFLMLLKGVIDCPDLPLNVSRSALQNDGFVKKISDYITKKVADKLTGMFKVERDEYEKYWDDLSPFIKFGCLKDSKFCEKMNDAIIFKDLNGSYLTLKEYLNGGKKEEQEDGEGASATGENGEKIEAEVVTEDPEKAGNGEGAEKKQETVYYVTDEKQQSQYVNMFRSQNMNAVILTHSIDNPFISQLEQKNENIRFMRIDADIAGAFKEETDGAGLEKENESLEKLFRKVLNKEKLSLKVEKLKDAKVSAVITLSEESRRFRDMMKMYGMGGMDPDMMDGNESQTLTLNANHPLVQYVFENCESDDVNIFVEQLYDLALLAHTPLAPEAMTKFVERSNDIMMKLAGR